VTAPLGEVFAEFTMQDSGCLSYGVVVDGRRLFVKAPTSADAAASLRRAMAVHAAVAHPAIVPLLDTVATDAGPALVYPWVDGKVLYGAPAGGRAQRLEPGGPYARFRALPVAAVLAAIEAISDAHLAVAAAEFVSVDLYDGCFLYDFDAGRMWICDLDEYRPGPFTVDADRLPGSTRFMAPEEFQRGAIVDQRTTVFHLGRTGRVLLDAGDLDREFRGSRAMAAVLERATQPDPSARHATVAEFVGDWRRATT
jgi:serine/threonine protein kinase